MDGTKLLPCPFCGGEVSMAAIAHDGEYHAFITRGYSLKKKNCWCRLFMESDKILLDRVDFKEERARVRKKLAEAWNRRAESNELQFTRKFIHEQGLDFALMEAWNRRTNNE